MSKTIDVTHLAKLINVPTTDEEVTLFSSQFNSTLQTIATLNELNTKETKATPQVTNLKNIYREDVIDNSRTFTQKEALSNAHQAHKGYFVVPGVLNET